MEKIQYLQLKKRQIGDLARFVVEENYLHHGQLSQDEYEKVQIEIEEIYSEEMKFSHSKIFAAVDEKGSLIGTIRVFKWNQTDVLPIEKIFPLRVNSFLNRDERKEVWHIGRFAIRKGMDKTGFVLFKTLMAKAISEICKNPNAVAIAECDAKLLKTVKLLGIGPEVIWEPVFYLGSETIPVVLRFAGLQNFLGQHTHLLHHFDRTIPAAAASRVPSRKYSYA